MHYLVVDGMISGTGIRNPIEGGYIEPKELGLDDDFIKQISDWLSRYEQAHYAQFNNQLENEHLDREGVLLCKLLRKSLPGSKIDYFSSAKMHNISVD